MGDTRSSFPEVQEDIPQQLEVLEGLEDRVGLEDHQEVPHMVQGSLQHVQESFQEVQGVQEVQRCQDIDQEHSWYEIPRLAPRFRAVQPDAENSLLALLDDGMQGGAFPKRQEVVLQKTPENWAVA